MRAVCSRRWCRVSGGVCVGLFLLSVLAPPALSFEDVGDRKSLVEALSGARDALPPDASARKGRLQELVDHLRAGLALKEALVAYGAAEATVEVLLTGYHEPLLEARRERDERFRHPLYRLPAERGLRAKARREIDDGALDGHGLELAWLDDPVESFFLHVQGSGRLRLGNGNSLRLGYAGNNGHAYYSIGSELVSRGAMTAKEATAPAIKSWLRSHPGEMSGVLHTNPRYIFFREIDVERHLGPPGAMGAPLVPMRSVAVDPRVTPLGAVGLLEAPLPGGSMLQRVVVAMDTGAAIRGATRIDLFTGAGDDAENLAGVLRARGQIRWLE